MNRIWKFQVKAKRLRDYVANNPGKLWLPYNRAVTDIAVTDDYGNTFVFFEQAGATVADIPIDAFMEMNGITNEDIGF